MEAIDLSINVIVLLCLAALVAGFVDTLVGGGGLITIPALLMAGVPPIYALGTNKLQAVTGTLTASIVLHKKGRIELSKLRGLLVMAFLGSILGTIAVQYFEPDLLKLVVPIVLLVIASYFIFVPSLKDEARSEKISQGAYGKTAVPLVGAYDGMFGPATGSFFVLSGVLLRGQSLIDATANAKALNFATNAASLLVFAFYGKLLIMVGALMMIGQVIGATVGARTLLVVDPNLLRYLIVGVCMIMLVSWYVSNV
jgi:uncharacterized membrane protein YfcA